MSAKLQGKNQKTGFEFEHVLTLEQTQLGRARENNDLVLNDEKVSRWHAVVRQQGRRHLLVDLNSANGTFVNGQRIKEHLLEDGDSIAIGAHLFTYVKESAPSVQMQQTMLGNTIVLRSPSAFLSTLSGASFSKVTKDSSFEDLREEVETLRKKAETLAYIYELNRLLSSVFSLEDIIDKLSEMVFRLTTAERFFVLLRKGDSDELTPHIAKYRVGVNLEALKDVSISQTVVDRVKEERVSLLSSDAQADERLAMSHSIIAHRVQSIICVPLLSQNDLLGAIYIDCNNLLQALGANDLDLLNALAATASMAIDNAKAHEQLVKETLARAAYGRFLPEHVVNEILANPAAFSLGGKNQLATILFSDIRGFTAISETLPPETLILLLNRYFSVMTPIVFHYQGLLDKFMGDGMMALFGVPLQEELAAINAVSAAVEIQRRMLGFNEELQAAGLPQVATGIGINTGKVTVGYIGSERRADYSAVGDAVNLAARLEKQAEGGQIVISEDTLAVLHDRFPVTFIGERPIKGKRESVRLYEVVWQGDRQSPLTKI